MKRLSGRIAFITGGARGIGLGIAKRFVEEGGRVALADINEEEARNAASEIGDNAIGIACDVANVDSVANAVEEAVRRFEKIDIAVNCAGYSKIVPIEQTTDELWNRTISINLTGAFHVCRAIIPQMKERRWGRIINLSSQSGKKGNSAYAAYCASKFGVIGLTQALSQELAEDGITVNAICPGVVFTEMWGPEQVNAYASKRNMRPEDVKDYLVGKIPMKRAATIEDVAGVAAFLSSEDADYLTGQSYNVTGGTIMH